MGIPIIPAVVIGGVTYTLVKQPSPDQVNPGATQYKATSGATIGQMIDGVHAVPPSSAPPATGSMSARARYRSLAANMPLTPTTNWTYPASASNIDPELQQKLDAAEAYAKQQFQNMDDVAKGKAADWLNKTLKLDPPLTGHEQWEAVASIAGGAAGAVAGTAVCGPLCGKVGALAGAYLGVKLEDLLAKNYDDMKSWLSDKWGDLKGDLGEAVDDIKGAAGDVIDFINPF